LVRYDQRSLAFYTGFFYPVKRSEKKFFRLNCFTQHPASISEAFHSTPDFYPVNN